jgi:hypothetical protein
MASRSTWGRPGALAFRAEPFTDYDNNGSQDVRALCVITPAAIGPQYFREVAEAMNVSSRWATGR